MPTLTCKMLHLVPKEAEAAVRRQALHVSAELARLTGLDHHAATDAMRLSEVGDGRMRVECDVAETGQPSLIHTPNEDRLKELLAAFAPATVRAEAYEVDVLVQKPTPPLVEEVKNAKGEVTHKTVTPQFKEVPGKETRYRMVPDPEVKP